MPRRVNVPWHLTHGKWVFAFSVPKHTKDKYLNFVAERYTTEAQCIAGRDTQAGKAENQDLGVSLQAGACQKHIILCR